MKRIIIGKIYKSDDTPWLNAKGYIQLLNNSYTNLIQYPENITNYITNDSGDIKTSQGTDLYIWCNEEGNTPSEFRFFLPSGKYFNFSVPFGTSPIQLSVLRENLNNLQPGYQSIVSYVDAAVENIAAGISMNIYSESLIAQNNLSASRIINLNTGDYAASNNPSHAYNAFGFLKAEANQGELIKLLTQGLISDSSWNWLSNLPIYLGNDGFLSQVVLDDATFIQEIARAISSQKITLNFKETILL